MTTTSIKCLQSRDIDAIDNETPCVIIGGSSVKETAVGGDTAQDARDEARESGAYGCEISTVGEWARTAPAKQAYVLEDRGEKDGPVWWLSEVAVEFVLELLVVGGLDVLRVDVVVQGGVVHSRSWGWMRVDSGAS